MIIDIAHTFNVNDYIALYRAEKGLSRLGVAVSVKMRSSHVLIDLN